MTRMSLPALAALPFVLALAACSAAPKGDNAMSSGMSSSSDAMAPMAGGDTMAMSASSSSDAMAPNAMSSGAMSSNAMSH